MPEAVQRPARTILTPDQRLRVFVSSAPEELASERAAVVRAIRSLRMSPVTLELGARPYAARDLYRSYIEQSNIFIGIYHESYGSLVPDLGVSALEDEFILSEGMPHLIYVKRSSERDPRLEAMLGRIRDSGGLSYRRFGSEKELEQLVADDLAVLLSERFSGDESSTPSTRPSTPVTTSTFIGRIEELEYVLGLLRDPSVRLVTLCGPGGVGKTRLALEASRRLIDEFPDGAVVVWLDALRDPDLVLQAIAADLDVRDRSGRSLLAALGDRLSGKRMLVILDNFEHVMTAAPKVNDLVSLATGSKFLITSRELLRVRGEYVLQLDPFPVPDAEMDLDTLSGLDAVRFFVDRAQAVVPSFSLTDDNALAIRQIVECVDGLPLALELAAARVRILSPQALAGLLSTSMDVPAGTIRDLPARQRTMRGAVGWSFDLLDEAERTALERFSVFAGTASLDAAQDVLGGGDGSTSLEMLASLVDKSLIQQVDEEGEPRFRMMVAIRDYALEKLRHRGAEDDAREAHAYFFSSLALETGHRMHSPEQARCLAAFEREHDNHQAALAWYLAQERVDEGLELCNRLRWFWSLRGHLRVADHWLRRFLALEGATVRNRGAGLVSAAMMALDLGELGRAENLFEEGIRLAESAGDADEVAWARTGLGAVRRTMGDIEEAERLQHLALEGFRKSDILIGQCTATTRLADLALARGDYEDAETRLNESLAVRRKTKDPWGTGYVLAELGGLRLVENDLIRAEDYLREALDAMESVGNVDGIARCRDLLGRVAAGRGDWPEAVDLFQHAHALYRGIGHRTGIAATLAHLARSECELGRIDLAVQHAFDAFALADEVGHPRSLSGAVEAIAVLMVHAGRARPAAELLGTAAEIRRRNQVRVSPGDALGVGSWEQKISSRLSARELHEADERGRAASLEDLRRAVIEARTELGAPEPEPETQR